MKYIVIILFLLVQSLHIYMKWMYDTPYRYTNKEMVEAFVEGCTFMPQKKEKECELASYLYLNSVYPERVDEKTRRGFFETNL